jgi:hypothetical protein
MQKQNIIYKKQYINMVFVHYNLFASVIAVLLVYGWRSLTLVFYPINYWEFIERENVQLFV